MWGEPKSLGSHRLSGSFGSPCLPPDAFSNPGCPQIWSIHQVSLHGDLLWGNQLRRILLLCPRSLLRGDPRGWSPLLPDQPGFDPHKVSAAPLTTCKNVGGIGCSSRIQAEAKLKVQCQRALKHGRIWHAGCCLEVYCWPQGPSVSLIGTGRPALAREEEVLVVAVCHTTM